MNKWRGFSLIICVALCVAAAAALFLLAGDAARAQGATRYVATIGVDSGGCTDPGRPCATVQYAVDQAAGGDVVKVASGTYTGVQGRPVPPEYFNPLVGDVVTQVVFITKTMSIQGGYTVPGFADPPDPIANPTTLDAQGQGRVMLIAGTIDITIEGLRITGGDADQVGRQRGAGVYIINATVTLRDNQVLSNTAQYSGGGLYLYASDATLSGNTIDGNTAIWGSGLSLYGGTATLTGNTFNGNDASLGGALWKDSGGGLSLGNCDVTLDDNTITNNSAWYGGGLELYGSTAMFTGNTISGNRSVYGGGLYLWQSTAILNDNTITANDDNGLYLGESTATLNGNAINDNAGDVGAGLRLLFSNATLNGNTISGNTGNVGGGLYLELSSATLYGNTIRDNTVSNVSYRSYGGGLYLEGSDVTLVNNVVAGNQAGTSGSGLYVADGSSARLLHTTLVGLDGGDGIVVAINDWSMMTSTIALTNTILVSHTLGISVAAGCTATLESTLWSGNGSDWAGAGTIGHVHDYAGQPAFVDVDAGDYHLRPGSAALDQGVETGLLSDIDHQPRPYLAPDLGADEYWPPGALKHGYLPLILRSSP